MMAFSLFTIAAGLGISSGFCWATFGKTPLVERDLCTGALAFATILGTTSLFVAVWAGSCLNG